MRLFVITFKKLYLFVTNFYFKLGFTRNLKTTSNKNILRVLFQKNSFFLKER